MVRGCDDVRLLGGEVMVMIGSVVMVLGCEVVVMLGDDVDVTGWRGAKYSSLATLSASLKSGFKGW